MALGQQQPNKEPANGDSLYYLFLRINHHFPLTLSRNSMFNLSNLISYISWLLPIGIAQG